MKFKHIEKSPLHYDGDLKCHTGENGRRYWTPEGKKYPSITTVLGAMDQGGLDAWRSRVGEREAERVGRIAAQRGTKIHEMCENYLNNKELNLKSELPLFQMGFKILLQELNKISLVYHQEIALYSDRFGIAGRVDCIGVYDGCLSIIDFKTSAKMKKREWIEGYFIQTSFYAAAYYELTGIAIKQIVIMIMTDEGRPQIFKDNPFKYLKRLKEVKADYDSQNLPQQLEMEF